MEVKAGMKKILQMFSTFLVVIVFYSLSFAEENLTVEKLLASPNKYVEKEVIISGYMFRNSFNANQRYSFSLCEKKPINAKPCSKPVIEVNVAELPGPELQRLFNIGNSMWDGTSGDYWEKGQEGLLTVKGILKQQGNNFYIALAEFPKIGGNENSSIQISSGENNVSGIKNLTLLITVNTANNEVLSKLSHDKEIKKEILNSTASLIEAWKGKIPASYTASLVITFEPYDNTQFRPRLDLYILKGKYDFKGVERQKRLGQIKIGYSDGGFLYFTEYNEEGYKKMKSEIIESTSTHLALYFSNLK